MGEWHTHKNILESLVEIVERIVKFLEVRRYVGFHRSSCEGLLNV